MNADPRVMEYFAAPLSPAESDAMIQRIQAHMERHGFGFFAAALRDTGEFIGMVGMSHVPFEAHFTPCVEIGWRIVRGVLESGLRHGRGSRMPALCVGSACLAEVVAFTVPANLRSRRVMEKLGMTRNPADDFDHPRLPEGHPLRRHVLYRTRLLQSQ